MPKNKIFSLILILILIGTGITAYLLMSTNKRSFPTLSETGGFFGMVKLDIGEMEFFVYKEAPGGPVSFSVSDSHWRGDVKGNTYKLLSADAVYELVGKELAPGRYEGVLQNEDGDSSGEWKLTKIEENKSVHSMPQVQELNTLLNLSSALKDIESKIEAHQTNISQQKNEIERLSEYLTEGQAFRLNADKKYKEKKADLEALQAVKNSKLKEAGQLREKFEISQRLFGTGKLVYLSRNTLDLEKRWFESMYVSTGVENDSDFDALVAKAERIILLKKEIAYELNRFGTNE